MADKQINIVIGADINKLEKGFKDAVKIIGASGKTIDSQMEAVVKSIESDFERIANSPNTKRTVAQLQNLALKVQALGPEFEDMANKIIKSAGQIKDKVGDAGDKIKYFSSDTRRMDAVVSAAQGIAGAFGVAQGAAALFGSENEELQKTMLKVQGAIAVMNGIQAIQNVLKEESAALTGFQALQEEALALATYASASAMNAFKVALAATGIGLAVVGIGLLIAKFMEQSEKQEKAAEIAKKYRDELIKNTTEAESNGRTLGVYLGIVKNTNKSDAERTVALRKINELGVATSDINIKSGESLALLTQRTNGYIDVLKKKAVAESFNLEIADAAKKLNEAKNNTVLIDAERRANEALGRAIQNNYKVYEFTKAREAQSAAIKKGIAKADAELTAVITKQAQAVNDLVAAESKVKTTDQITSENNAKKKANDDAIKNEKEFLKLKQDLDKELNKQKPVLSNGSMNPTEPTYEQRGGSLGIAKKQKEDTLKFTESISSDIITAEQDFNGKKFTVDMKGIENTRKILAANQSITDEKIKQRERDKQANDQFLADNEKFTEGLNKQLQSIAGSGFDKIGVAIGESIMTGSDAIANSMRIIIESIGDFITAYGSALIAYGVSKLAFDKALKNGDPVVAISAGIAAVATGYIVKSLAPKAFADGGIVSGPTMGLVGEYPGASTNPEVIAPLDKLKGMLMPMNSKSQFGSLETRISGRDLVILMNREERALSRG